MSTVAEMVSHVQAFAPSLSLTSTAILVDLNNALQDLFEEADLEATTGVGSESAMVTVASQQRYNLPSNCVKPRWLQWRISGVLCDVIYADLDAFRDLSRSPSDVTPTSGILRWTVWGNQILLYPIPTEAGTQGNDGELILDFYKIPATLVDGGTPDIPAQYHNLLEYWATSMAFAKNEEGQWAEYWMDLYRKGKSQMQVERTVAQRAMPARVRPARW